jgi:hypothetical protein
MTPKLCKAGQQLRLQIDDSYPDRDRTSDGWIGNLAHQATKSDHNPDKAHGNVVRAIDLDRDLSGKAKPDLMPYLADEIRRFAKKDKSKRISYIIFNGKIASSRMGWRWRKYSGINPHTAHCHISFTKKGDADGSFFNIPMIGGTK